MSGEILTKVKCGRENGIDFSLVTLLLIMFEGKLRKLVLIEWLELTLLRT